MSGQERLILTQEQVMNLTKDISHLREALLKDLGFKGVKVPERIREANHV